jgi:hypothetical protein
LPVDAAAQAAAKAAFFATVPKPVTGNPVKVPEFNASCKVSHHGSDDPIVFPGLAGASHNHTFIGNKTTNGRVAARRRYDLRTSAGSLRVLDPDALPER